MSSGLSATELTPRLVELNAAYARAIDDGRFEAWPELFVDPCLYKVTTVDNLARGLESGIIYADSQGMLRDRISALREANIYEQHRYRHIVGLPTVTGQENGEARVETPFIVVRIMRTGTMEMFAAGRYLDRVVSIGDGSLRLRERIVACDGARFDTLVALPL